MDSRRSAERVVAMSGLIYHTQQLTLTHLLPGEGEERVTFPLETLTLGDFVTMAETGADFRQIAPYFPSLRSA